MSDNKLNKFDSELFDVNEMLLHLKKYIVYNVNKKSSYLYN